MYLLGSSLSSLCASTQDNVVEEISAQINGAGLEELVVGQWARVEEFMSQSQKCNSRI
jgi:hypothetical protein